MMSLKLVDLLLAVSLVLTCLGSIYSLPHHIEDRVVYQIPPPPQVGRYRYLKNGLLLGGVGLAGVAAGRALFRSPDSSVSESSGSEYAEIVIKKRPKVLVEPYQRDPRLDAINQELKTYPKDRGMH